MSTDTEALYPEHTKQSAVLDQSQAIGEFLDTSEFVLAEYCEVAGYPEPQLVPVALSIEQVLAQHFDIDLQAIEAEKRAMLAALSEAG